MATIPNEQDHFGPEEFAARTGVSRETLARLKTLVAMLGDWNARHNLVSVRSLPDVWRRHVWDSAQLCSYIGNDAATLADLGSGAGFPGLVLAELLRGRVQVTLFESIAKKCAFLRAVSDRLDLGVRVENRRMETSPREIFDVVTARACAPLDRLLGYAQHFAGPGTVCLFLKGQNVALELTEARKNWMLNLQQHPSLTDPSGAILEIRELAHAGRGAKTAKGPGRRQPERRRRQDHHGDQSRHRPRGRR
ncbi:MAG TPA: 16S rRNA (guanine(527)-N(7))-methyltransferase RsmG [Rhizomicrobium sp.]|jgi:16S rRNA (guanine527-N7)-methyltransferase|nr:16S rRNA (guanine(527)-N(7))-methyltransferase RsmG [Rhizomicrobium sp.]